MPYRNINTNNTDIITETAIRKIQPKYRSPFRLSLRSPIRSNKNPKGGIKNENIMLKQVNGFLSINLAE